MKKAQDNLLPMVQQGASMMMQAGTGANNMMIPEGFMLIPQGPAWPQSTVSAQLSTNYGKHHAKNQRRKARREQNAMHGANINVKPPVVQAPTPPSAQLVSSPRAEQVVNPNPYQVQPGMNGEPAEGRGYNTEEYARMKANKLAMRGESNLPADALLKDVKKLYHYFYALSRVLVTPAPDSTGDIINLWRYVKNGYLVITGANLLNVITEIMFFFYTYGNPMGPDGLLAPVLTALNMKGIGRNVVLDGLTEKSLVQLSPEDIVTKIDKVTKSGAYNTLRHFLEVLDNYGTISARVPHGAVQSCYKFAYSSNKARTVLDVYQMASSNRYREAFKMLSAYVRYQHEPLMNNHEINVLLRNTGLSLHKFRGFAYVEIRAEEEATEESEYPTENDLMNLCGLPAKAQDQINETIFLIDPLVLKVDAMAKEQARMLQIIQELHGMIQGMAATNNANVTSVPVPPNVLEQVVEQAMVVEVATQGEEPPVAPIDEVYQDFEETVRLEKDQVMFTD